MYPVVSSVIVYWPLGAFVHRAPMLLPRARAPACLVCGDSVVEETMTAV